MCKLWEAIKIITEENSTKFVNVNQGLLIEMHLKQPRIITKNLKYPYLIYETTLSDVFINDDNWERIK